MLHVIMLNFKNYIQSFVQLLKCFSNRITYFFIHNISVVRLYLYEVVNNSKIDTKFKADNFVNNTDMDFEQVSDNFTFSNFVNLTAFFYDTDHPVYVKKLRPNKYMANFYNKRITTYRCARLVHWRLFTPKTIREGRYRLFLKKRLKNQTRDFSNTPYYFFLLNLQIQLPWHYWAHILEYFKLIFQHKFMQKGVIYQLPLDFTFYHRILKFKKKQYNWVKYARRWSRGNYTRKTRFWLTPRKRLPKVFKQLVPKIRKLNYILQLDYLTLSFVILKDRKLNIECLGIWRITENNMLKLLSYRYRP